MLNRFISLFGGGDPKKEEVKAKKVSITSSIEDEEVPRYPPFVKGLPMLSPERLIESQDEVVVKIRQTLGLPPAEYDRLITPLLINCAKFVHLLPASENHHHCGAGGLLRHLLEVGAWSAQFSEGKIFAYGKPPEQRKHEEPRWTVAAFTAGLLHDIGKAATDMQVTAPDGKLEWSPFIMPMSEWGEMNNVERYFVRWRKDRHKKHEKVVPILANHVLPIELKDWLGSQYPEIIHAMLEAASYNYDRDEPRQASVLGDLVSMADRESTSRDRKMTESMGSAMAVGVPVDRHLMDAARRLFSDGTWKMNQKGARIWYTKEGVFIAWKYASEEILQILAEDNVLGIPRNKDTMADILVERGIALKNNVENPKNPRNYWSVHPEVLDTNKGPIWLQCLKLNSWDILSSYEPPAPPIKAYLKGVDGEIHVLGGAIGEQSPFVAYAPGNTPEAGDSGKPDSQKSVPSSDGKAASEKPGPRMPSSKKAEDGSPSNGPKMPSASTEKPAEPVKEKQPEPVKAPESSPEQIAARQSHEWLERHGSEASKVLLKMFGEIALNIKGKEDIFGEESGVIYLHHPRAVKEYGKPSEVISFFADAGWLVPDPENPTRKARDMSGGKGLVMNSEVAEHIRNILKGGAKKPDLAPIPKPEIKRPEKKPEQAKASPSKPAAQPQQKPAAPQPSVPPKATSDGRPPAPARKDSSEAIEMANAYIEKIRNGEIQSTPKTEKDGSEWLSVGATRLNAFLAGDMGSNLHANLVLAVLLDRDDFKRHSTQHWVMKV